MHPYNHSSRSSGGGGNTKDTSFTFVSAVNPAGDAPPSYDNQAYVPTSGDYVERHRREPMRWNDMHNDVASTTGVGYSSTRPGSDGRYGTGPDPRSNDQYVYGQRVAGLVERDPMDLDVLEDDDEMRDVEGQFCGEARLNCSRFAYALKEQAGELRHAVSKVDFRKSALGWMSLEGLRQRVPIVAWLPKYCLEDFQGDLIAGITVGLTLIPQAIAYSGIAGLAPQRTYKRDEANNYVYLACVVVYYWQRANSETAKYGLYSAFIGPFIYLVFGCSKDIALGPSAIASLMTMVYGKALFPKDPQCAIWLGLWTGVVELIMYFVGFGYLLDFISFPVLKAFSTAAAITIGMSQVKKWWGLRGIPGEFIPQLVQTIQGIPKTRLWDFLLGVVSIFFIVLLKKMKEYKWKTKYEDLPPKWKVVNKAIWFVGTSRNTIVIVVSSLVAYGFELHGMVPFSLTGYIPPGIPSWTPPPATVTDPNTRTTYTMSDIASRIGLGFIIVPLVSLIEALSIGKVLGRKFNYKYDTNQEFLSYGLLKLMNFGRSGITNILGAFVQGYPVTGTYSRTAVNAGSGVRTQMGNLFTGIIVLIALAFLTPLFYYIPHASLGVVIIMAVVDTITFHKLWIFWKTKRIDVIPWIVTFILSFILSVEYGIGIGCLVQLVIMLYDIFRPTITVYEYEPCATHLDETKGASSSTKVIVAEMSSNFLYPAVDYIKEQVLSHALKGGTTGVVIDMQHVADCDTSTVQGMRELLGDLNKKYIKVVVCGLQKRVATVFRRAKPQHFVKASNVKEAIDIMFGLSPDSSGGRTNGNELAVTSSTIVADCSAMLSTYSAESECSTEQRVLNKILDDNESDEITSKKIGGGGGDVVHRYQF